MGSVDTLCCCEYENVKGERSHILAVCCDCEALDEIADRCFKCQKIPTSLMDRFLDTTIDRLRLPGIIGGGATRIDLEVATPIIVIPASLALAAYGPIMTMVVLTFLPYFCFFFYRTWTRKTNRSRTKFFFVWGLVSVIYMYILFETIICRHTNISYKDNFILSVCIFTMSMALLYAKKDPGYVLNRQISPAAFSSLESVKEVQEEGNSDSEDGFEVIDREELKSVMRDGGEKHEPPDPMTWCNVCERDKPPRVGHCSVCNACVKNRDHHCVWIDSCVGLHNHRSFLVAMALFVFTGYYGSYVTMCAVCDPTYPHDAFCGFYTAYRDFKWGLCYVSAWYSVMVTCIMCFGLIFQIILISQNLTSQELHYASKMGQTRFYIYSTKNPYNKGLLRNWADFCMKRRYLQTQTSYSNV